MWGAKANPYNVRNLAYLALSETTKIPDEAEYVGCATCVITRGVSSIRVSSRRLVVPTQDMDLRHATFLFCAERGVAKGKVQRQKRM